MELLLKGNILLPLLPSDPNCLHAINDHRCIFECFFLFENPVFPCFFFRRVKNQ